jgi:AraC-like DNA-binding protein
MKSNSDSDELIPNFKSSFKFEELVNQFYENDCVSTLERLVKTKYGITPKQFITDIKLSKAEVLIRQGNKNIKQIASEIGFNSVAYFCHCFKKKFGKPPKAYSDFMQKK